MNETTGCGLGLRGLSILMRWRREACRAQESRAKRLEQNNACLGMRPSQLKVGDLVLLSTDHYNIQMPIQKLTPSGLDPSKCLKPEDPTLSKNLKPYHTRPPEVGLAN